MTKRGHNNSHWVETSPLLYMCCMFLVLTGSAASVPSQTIDLSYLYRCGEGSIAATIQGRLEEAQTKQSSVVLDIDLTASLIGKNITEVLASLKGSEQQQQQQQQQAADCVPVKLTARRNHLSPGEATAVLEFVLENGPTNETTTIATTTIDESENGAEKDDEAPAEETPASIVAEEAEDADNNADAASEPTTLPTTESNSEDSNVQEEAETVGMGKVQEEAETTKEETPTTTITKTTRIKPAFVSIRSLDLGWNNLGSAAAATNKKAVRAWNGALRRLLADSERCPPAIKLDVCGLGPQACRDLAKGIVDRYSSSSKDNNIQPLSLDLACNEGIGDVGVAALAAAIRTVASPSKEPKKKRKKKRKGSKQRSLQAEEHESSKEDAEAVEPSAKEESSPEEQTETTTTSAAAESKEVTRTILEKLDLSGCGIGDVGAEALAIALANNPLCVKHLDLSNNKISDRGAAALAQALTSEGGDVAGFVETLDLSHNTDLGDAGAKNLALAFQRDGIASLILRSCNVRADGAACFGTALRSLGSELQSRQIDLSGNPLGILSKKKKSGNKYSATALRSKATDTTKAYMNIIGKSLQKGLNSINGVGDGMDTLESDDEEDRRMGETEEEDESMKKCGALSLAEAFIRDGFEGGTKSTEGTPCNIELGLRHCSFDTRAAEALAAVLHESREHYPAMNLSMDMAMNHVLEEDIIAALHGEDGYDDQLADMAEVYLDALEVMREARERALQASRMAAARAKAEAEREAAWGAPPPSYRNDDYGGREEEWSGEDEDWGHANARNYERDVEEDYSEEEW